MEVLVGRPLLPTEHVHHLDGNKQNNNPENLELLSASVHNSLTHLKYPFLFYCPNCGRPFMRDYNRNPVKLRFHNRSCRTSFINRRYWARRRGLPPPTPAKRWKLSDLLHPA
jgi:hypothetical protein